MKVILFGFMGSGKTTYGKMLAKDLNHPFIDLDEYIEETRNKTIKQIFEFEGEQRFREIEREAMLEIIEKDKFILASGGGTPCFFDNIEIMKKKAITVYLNASVDVLVERLLAAKIHRPLIWGKSKTELQQYIVDTLEKRNPYYKKAHIIVNADDLNIDNLTWKLKTYNLIKKLKNK
jgi:shikimate kinase